MLNHRLSATGIHNKCLKNYIERWTKAGQLPGEQISN